VEKIGVAFIISSVRMLPECMNLHQLIVRWHNTNMDRVITVFLFSDASVVLQKEGCTHIIYK